MSSIFPQGSANKRKKLISICLISGFTANFLGQGSQLLIGKYETLPINIGFLSFYATCFAINYFGFTLIAGYLMSYGCAIIIIFSSILLGFERHLLIFFIPLIIANYFLIDFKNSKMVLLQLLFPILYMLADKYFDLSIYQISHSPPEVQKYELMISTTLAMGMASIFVYFIIKEAYNSEKSIQDSLITVSEQNDELIKRNDELDRFVYSVSHELRAPIATMRGLHFLINNEENQDEINKYLAMEEKCLFRLDEYIKDILNYYANNRLNLLIEGIDFNKKVTENLEKFEFQIAHQGMEVDTSIQDIKNFYSDSYRLNMIFNNILSNAVKYYDMNKLQKTIAITISGDEKNIEIRIKDNGIGIAKSELPNIFTMFHKSEITSSSSGLGMYIVKESTEKLEGTIKIQSEKREFTELIICIPNLKKYYEK